jgi:hypothetical protein
MDTLFTGGTVFGRTGKGFEGWLFEIEIRVGG